MADGGHLIAYERWIESTGQKLEEINHAGVQRRCDRQHLFRGRRLVATPGLSAYQASKHGVIGLPKVAAMECATQNIRVNAICPGGTRSDMFDRWIADPKIDAQVLAAHPVGRFADPMEQAEVALLLLSDAASFVTGVALPVDGGLTVP